jgi:hypothetical protein
MGNSSNILISTHINFMFFQKGVILMIAYKVFIFLEVFIIVGMSDTIFIVLPAFSGKLTTSDTSI